MERQLSFLEYGDKIWLAWGKGYGNPVPVNDVIGILSFIVYGLSSCRLGDSDLKHESGELQGLDDDSKLSSVKCAKEKNRQAQRRFRERQKGLISNLKESRDALQKQVLLCSPCKSLIVKQCLLFCQYLYLASNQPRITYARSYQNIPILDNIFLAPHFASIVTGLHCRWGLPVSNGLTQVIELSQSFRLPRYN